MKLKSIFATALAAIVALSSCSKDNDGSSFPNEGAEARMGLSFTLPASLTRAEAVEGVGIENVIETVSVYVFDATGKATEGNATSFALADFDEADGTYTLKNGLKVSAGNRRVYISANVNLAPATEAALKAAKIEMASAASSSSLGMFSDVQEVAFNAQDNETAEENAGRNAVQNVALERIVAKVVVTKDDALSFSQTFTGTEFPENYGASYVVDNWGIGNTVKSVFAIEGTASTGEYEDFADDGFTNLVGALADAKTTAAKVYVGENKPESKGEATYVMVRTKITPTHVASVAQNDDKVTWTPYSGEPVDMYIALDINKKPYFCLSETDAKRVLGVLGVSGDKSYAYKGGFVYYRTFIKGDDSIILRNEFIHLNITGIKDNIFGGLPGDPVTGGTPTDPTDPGNNPDPIDPTEPSVEGDAYMIFDVTVSPWVYGKSDIEL